MREGHMEDENPGLGERAFIEALVRRFRPAHAPVRLGIGDDAAVLVSPRADTVLSVDVMVEGVHFQPGWFDDRDLGFRAVVSALSDLAAMGATPSWALVSMGCPPNASAPRLLAIADGIGEAALAYAIDIVGGDTSRSPVLFLSITVGGTVEVPLGRSGGRAGDALVVSGPLGAARAALLHLMNPARGGPLEAVTAVRKAFERPRADFDGARRLRAAGARALIDISDGLLSEAAHLARAAGLSAVIERGAVPLDPNAAILFETWGLDAQLEAAASGEEYVLLAAMAEPSREVAPAAGATFRHVGALVERRDDVDVFLRDETGTLTVPDRLGWTHF